MQPHFTTFRLSPKLNLDIKSGGVKREANFNLFTIRSLLRLGIEQWRALTKNYARSCISHASI